MKLSIVILCWNDRRVICDCLESVYRSTHRIEFEVIVSDNGSTDGSAEEIRARFPRVCVIENGRNLRFSKGNNVGIAASRGEYILILNPDTIIHDGALDRWVNFAEEHAEAGAFGCRVLNPDGTYQGSAQPFPTISRDLIGALYLRGLSRVFSSIPCDTYAAWPGDTERAIDWQCGCCVMFRGSILRALGGFDERFFYYYEDVDVCHRVWRAGYSILYTPAVTITHLGGQSTRRAPLAFEVDKYRNRYRYFYKYYGRRGVRCCRLVALAWVVLRYVAHGAACLVKPTENRKHRLALLRVALRWNMLVHPVRFVEQGIDPQVRPAAPAQG